jgi:hypothetical protein
MRGSLITDTIKGESDFFRSAFEVMVGAGGFEPPTF